MKSQRLPRFIPMRDLDAKIGGNEIDRLRRWHKQGKLSKSRGMARSHFPETSSPRAIAKLIRQGILQNARFAAAVLVQGVQRGSKEDVHILIRSDVLFPSLYTIRRQGRFATPVAFATAHVAAQFVKFFPKDESGVFAPETLPIETRRDILAGVRSQGLKILHKVTILKSTSDDEEESICSVAITALNASRYLGLLSSLRPRLKHQIERRLRRPPEPRKSAGSHHFPQPFFSSLRAQRQSDFLRKRRRRAQQCRRSVERAPDRIQIVFDLVARKRLHNHPCARLSSSVLYTCADAPAGSPMSCRQSKKVTKS